MSFSNFTIGARQAINSGILLIILVVMVILANVRFSVLSEDIEGLVKNRMPKIVLAGKIQNSYQNTARTLRNIVLAQDEAILKQEKEKYDKADAQLKADTEALEKMNLAPQAKEILSRIKSNLAAIKPPMDKCMSLALAHNTQEATTAIFKEVIPIQGKLLSDIDAIIKLFTEMGDAEAAKAVDDANGTKSLLLFLGCLGIILGVGSAYFISRSVTKQIRKAVEGLRDSSYQVASASSQVSSSSQQLASGASEQAAAVEETSSSLEEMSSMTKQNATNALQANQLMKEANLVVSSANRSMDQLTSSMEEISKASEETQRIIKTIDEIAFQTNLLALNAAVEAARAGEAGSGFAVVADEVRTLAMRSAEAAKNTENLIAGIVKKIQGEAELVARTNEEFGKVSQTVAKSGELVEEITAASKEQAQGIEQVTRAVTDIDKITQQNSANAEETASASEEMSAQAQHMREFVADMMKLVGEGESGAEEGAVRKAIPRANREACCP